MRIGDVPSRGSQGLSLTTIGRRRVLRCSPCTVALLELSHAHTHYRDSTKTRCSRIILFEIKGLNTRVSRLVFVGPALILLTAHGPMRNTITLGLPGPDIAPTYHLTDSTILSNSSPDNMLLESHDHKPITSIIASTRCAAISTSWASRGSVVW